MVGKVFRPCLAHPTQGRHPPGCVALQRREVARLVFPKDTGLRGGWDQPNDLPRASFLKVVELNPPPGLTPLRELGSEGRCPPYHAGGQPDGCTSPTKSHSCSCPPVRLSFDRGADGTALSSTSHNPVGSWGSGTSTGRKTLNSPRWPFTPKELDSRSPRRYPPVAGPCRRRVQPATFRLGPSASVTRGKQPVVPKQELEPNR